MGQSQRNTTSKFLYDTLGNVQKADVRFGVGLLSSGDYPQIDVKECLQAVGGEVLHVRIRQTRENLLARNLHPLRE